MVHVWETPLIFVLICYYFVTLIKNKIEKDNKPLPVYKFDATNENRVQLVACVCAELEIFFYQNKNEMV